MKAPELGSFSSFYTRRVPSPGRSQRVWTTDRQHKLSTPKRDYPTLRILYIEVAFMSLIDVDDV